MLKFSWTVMDAAINLEKMKAGTPHDEESLRECCERFQKVLSEHSRWLSEYPGFGSGFDEAVLQGIRYHFDCPRLNIALAVCVLRRHIARLELIMTGGASDREIEEAVQMQCSIHQGLIVQEERAAGRRYYRPAA